MSTLRPQSCARRADPPDADSELAPQGVGFLLGVAHRAHRRTWEAELADLDLTAPQAALLRLIAAQPGQGVRQLARGLGTDPMNVQRVATLLLASDLCEVRQDPDDARRRPLYPTDQGMRRARQIARRAETVEGALNVAFGAEGYATLLAGLQSLIALERRGTGPLTARPNARAVSGEMP